MLRSCLYFHLRLCLVVVKRFPENTYFLEMLISGKGKCFHVFGCISKNFPKNIFWCLEKKKENINPENTSHNSEKKKSSTTKMFPVRRPRRRSRFEIAINGAIAISDRDRADDRDIELELELAISDWSWSSRRLRGRRIGAREIDANWSSEFAGDRRTDWIFSSRARTLSLSLSLSLIFRKCFEGKIEV